MITLLMHFCHFIFTFTIAYYFNIIFTHYFIIFIVNALLLCHYFFCYYQLLEVKKRRLNGYTITILHCLFLLQYHWYPF
jgi:hypothetical protein